MGIFFLKYLRSFCPSSKIERISVIDPKPDDIPLLAALARAAGRDHVPFYTPGHKQGTGTPTVLKGLLGDRVFQADLPELPDLDNLFAPTGSIQAAQVLAAETFGAEETFFLANGSTCGIEAAVIAVCSPGEKILVPRNAHRSVLSALVLSGASPVYLAPAHTADWDLAFGTTSEQVQQALAAHPDIRAVLIVSPSYQGVCADIATISHHVHAAGRMLIVDEAHGAHLSFHPELPHGAIAGGADIVIQSTHKVLSALTQAAMLHVQGDRIDGDRLRQALQLTQSTSPSYLLLASLDAARYQMATAGQGLLGQTLDLATDVRSQLADLTPYTVLSTKHIASLANSFQLDATRLVIDVSALGITGFIADDFFHTELGVTAELPTLRQLTFILSLGNTPADGKRLMAAFHTLVEKSPLLDSGPTNLEQRRLNTPLTSVPPLSPREAFFARSTVVDITAAIGRIGTDTLCPYPPGIPVLLPGEVVTKEAIAYLQAIQNAGGIITGGQDDAVQSIRVVA